MSVELVTEVERRKGPLGDDARAEIGQIVLLEIGEDPLAVLRRQRFPVEVRSTQVGHRRQRIEGGATLRRQVRVGHRGRVQIDGEIIRKFRALVDLADQALIAPAEHDAVMPQLRIRAFHTEIREKDGRTERAAFECGRGLLSRGAYGPAAFRR